MTWYEWELPALPILRRFRLQNLCQNEKSQIQSCKSQTSSGGIENELWATYHMHTTKFNMFPNWKDSKHILQIRRKRKSKNWNQLVLRASIRKTIHAVLKRTVNAPERSCQAVRSKSETQLDFCFFKTLQRRNECFGHLSASKKETLLIQFFA